jgi:hypothetical protein
MISEYELERRKHIEENNAFLRKLGLLPNGSKKSTHIFYKVQHHLVDTYNHIMAHEYVVAKPDVTQPLQFIFVPHLEYDVTVSKHNLNRQRAHLKVIAQSASERLCDGGYFVVGVRDVRLSSSHDEHPILVPMGLLIQNDLQAFSSSLVLKETIIIIPHGHTRIRSKTPITISEESTFPSSTSLESLHFETDYVGDLEQPPPLPIVHTYYFLYMKH